MICIYLYLIFLLKRLHKQLWKQENSSLTHKSFFHDIASSKDSGFNVPAKRKIVHTRQFLQIVHKGSTSKDDYADLLKIVGKMYIYDDLIRSLSCFQKTGEIFLDSHFYVNSSFQHKVCSSSWVWNDVWLLLFDISWFNYTLRNNLPESMSDDEWLSQQECSVKWCKSPCHTLNFIFNTFWIFLWDS